MFDIQCMYMHVSINVIAQKKRDICNILHEQLCQLKHFIF